jgi:hypothetical protein
MFIPVYIAENTKVLSMFHRVNALVSGKRAQIFMIMLISSAIIWGALQIVLGVGPTMLLPYFILRYGIVALIQFPIQSFCYAYLFMLPAVIYHHLRLEELSRGGN